jgi:hypothetical protein
MPKASNEKAKLHVHVPHQLHSDKLNLEIKTDAL